jgi:transcriptional regulator with XRE-family HTH domain
MSDHRPTTDRVRANIRTARLARGLTLAQLSEALAAHGTPISVPVLSKLEIGPRSVDLECLLPIAEVLDVAPGLLIHAERICPTCTQEWW